MFNLDTFNGFVYGTVSEVIAQNIELWNEASLGTIRLVSGMENIGDTDHETIWKDISSLVIDRDIYDGDTDVDPVSLSMGDLISIKIAAATSPINIPPAEFTWIKKDPEEGGFVIGEQLARAMPQHQVNNAIAAAVAGLTEIGEQSAPGALDGTLLDISEREGVEAVISRATLNEAAGLHGDRSSNIVAWVVHSVTFHKIIGDNINNTNRLFTINNIAVMEDGLGRIFIVTDSPSLVGADGIYHTLGLVQNAAVVETNDDMTSILDDRTGKVNIQRTFQAEWSYNLSLKGMKYIGEDPSPTSAAVGTPANWGLTVSDIKNSPGVVITHLVAEAEEEEE